MSRSSSCALYFVACVALLGMTGCASTLTALTSPSISSDQLDESDRNGVRIEKNKIKTMSGDRRLMRAQFTDEIDSLRAMSTDGTLNTKWIICAETQADAIVARGGQSAVTVNAKGALDDEYIEALTVTNNRGQVSDVVRQIGWQVCNAYMNGALTKKQYSDHLIELRQSAFSALMQPKDSAAATLPVPATVTSKPNDGTAPEAKSKAGKQ